MQTEKRVNVPDLRDILEFWEMKDEIEAELFAAIYLQKVINGTSFAADTKRLLDRSRSIGKKENLDEK